jgi:hypothetical protein
VQQICQYDNISAPTQFYNTTDRVGFLTFGLACLSFVCSTSGGARFDCGTRRYQPMVCTGSGATQSCQVCGCRVITGLTLASSLIRQSFPFIMRRRAASTARKASDARWHATHAASRIWIQGVLSIGPSVRRNRGALCW